MGRYSKYLIWVLGVRIGSAVDQIGRRLSPVADNRWFLIELDLDLLLGMTYKFWLPCWSYFAASVTVGDYTDNNWQQAISDTGTSWLVIPYYDYRRITGAIGSIGEMDDVSVLYCNATATAPPLKLNIGGRLYSIPASEYILDVSLSFLMSFTLIEKAEVRFLMKDVATSARVAAIHQGTTSEL